MALKSYQKNISLGRLYELAASGSRGSIGEQLVENLYINSGSVDVYGYNGGTQPAAISSMTLKSANIAVEGVVGFDAAPRYIAVVQNTGTTTELVISGFEIVEDLGAIS